MYLEYFCDIKVEEHLQGPIESKLFSELVSFLLFYLKYLPNLIARIFSHKKTIFSSTSEA